MVQMNYYNRLRARRDGARLCKFHIPEKFLSPSNKYKIVVFFTKLCIGRVAANSSNESRADRPEE
jgi:hypothetical protein